MRCAGLAQARDPKLIVCWEGANEEDLLSGDYSRRRPEHQRVQPECERPVAHRHVRAREPERTRLRLHVRNGYRATPERHLHTDERESRRVLAEVQSCRVRDVSPTREVHAVTRTLDVPLVRYLT